MKVYKRGKIWYAVYYADGKRYRKALHTTNKAMAETWARQIEVAKGMPTFEEAVAVLRMFYKQPEEGTIALDAAWDTYIALAKATGKDALSPHTLRGRQNTVKRFVDWLKRERPMVKTIEEVTSPVATGFATFLAEEGLHSKTRINIIAELGTVWKMLENASTRIRNPWATLRPKNTDGKRGKAFTPQQEKKLLEAAKKVGKQWFEVCTIMRHTGLRYEDVALMTWDEVQGDVIRLKPKKTKRHDISVGIPIIEPVRKVLEAMPKVGAVMFPLHERWYDKNSHRYRVLNFKEVLVEAGLDGQGYTVHSWRHTSATRLAEAGANIETRKALLGHTVDATARRYDHDEHLGQKREALVKAAEIASE